MKKMSKLLIGLSLLFTLGLVGCQSSQPQQPSDPEVVEPSDPEEPTEPSEPGEPEDPQEPEIQAHSAEEVAGIFNEGISLYGLSASYYDIEGVYTGWYLGVSFGADTDDSEENLGSAVYTLAQFLPEFLELSDEGYDEATAEKPAQYSMFLVTEALDVAVEIYGFLEDGLCCAEIYIYDIVE